MLMRPLPSAATSHPPESAHSRTAHRPVLHRAAARPARTFSFFHTLVNPLGVLHRHATDNDRNDETPFQSTTHSVISDGKIIVNQRIRRHSPVPAVFLSCLPGVQAQAKRAALPDWGVALRGGQAVRRACQV